MLMRIAAATAALLGWAVAGTAGESLKVGDPAPALEVREFVKGDKVARLEKGKTYVIEFWATWCGPCRAIIPHLTKLQQKHKDVIFIGVSAYERNPKGVKAFVEKMGDKMAYRVALDAVPEGAEPRDGKMARAWMTAAAQWYVPRAFIVNADGKVAWIGHPQALDGPLGQIVAGTYDLKAAAAAYQRARVEETLLQALVKARQAGDPDALLEILDTALAIDGKLEEMLGLLKFETLAAREGERDKALHYGRGLVAGALKNDAARLNGLARSVVDSDTTRRDARLVEVALRAARRADELKRGKDPATADTLARAYFASGAVARAIEAQRRAITLARGTPLEKDKGLKERLERYKKAAQK
jgi:thiol-disulfide isomerase/thioredoxin